MTRSRKTRRVIVSDSESDLEDDSDELFVNANFTKRSSSHLGSNTKPSVDAVSDSPRDEDLGDTVAKTNDDNSSEDDDLGDTSRKSSNDTPSATFNKPNNSSEDELGNTSSKSNYDTPNATSTKRDLSQGNSTVRSNNYPPSSIRRPKAVKRKPDTLDPHRVSNRSSSSQNDGERPGQRQRPTRGKKVSYDMKHHPMDDILRPKYSAKRRGNGLKLPKDSSDHDAETDEDVTHDSVGGKIIQPPNLRRSSRKINQSATPIYSGKWHPLDQMLKDNAISASTRSKKSHTRSNNSLSTLKDEVSKTANSDLESDQDVARVPDVGDETTSINPEIRRSARVSTSQKTPPNYDMKYHVMDFTLRPKATANRMKSKIDSAISRKTHSKSASRFVHSEPEPVGSDVPVAPAWSQLQNPYWNRTSLNWAELQDMDRCIYLLQKGAPFHGNTIPQDWNHVKKMLFDEASISLDELHSQDGTKLLKTRYESVRLGLQNFFNSSLEPIEKEDWTLSKTEGFDVYDTKQGRNYWKHQKDSVVEKTSNRSPTLRVDIERMTPTDREGNGELSSIIENEDSLVETMREEYPLSDATLEKLLFPIEQYLIEESHRPFESFLTPQDKALDKADTLISESNVTHLDTSHRELAVPILHDKDKSTLSVEVNPRIKFGISQILKEQIKARKRKWRADLPIPVHEDFPGSTPQMQQIVSINPASPGTDIPKENLDDGESSMERSSHIEIENPQTHRRHESISTSSTRRVRRLGSATSVTSPYRSLFGGPLGSLSPGSSPTTR